MATTLSLCTFCTSLKLMSNACLALDDNISDLTSLMTGGSETSYSENMKLLKEDHSYLKRVLIDSPVPRTNELRKSAKAILLKSSQLLAKLSTPVSADVKPITSKLDGDSLGNLKMTPFSPPTFSGEQKDWTSFWSFKSIHETSKYTSSNKLQYLRQAQKNTELRRQLSTHIDNGDCYEDVVAELKERFDQPRAMHRIYVAQLLDMAPVKPYQTSITSCVNTLKTVIDGLTRLGQCNAESIMTYLVEDLLPKDLRSKWEDFTMECRTVPPIQDLMAFLKKRASQSQYADKPGHSTTSSEKKPPAKNRPAGSKGSIHVASVQPAQAPPPQPTPTRGNNVSNRPNSTPFSPCRYNCPLCPEAHYAYFCRVFKEKTVDQRKEFATTNSLCLKCLKPGHAAEQCRNKHTCQVCGAGHNTLLHGAAQGSSSPPTVQGTVNTAASTPSKSTPAANDISQNKLLMTCQAMATGPTGKSMPVRALLDSGADISSVTSKVANHLQLKPLESSVSVAAFGNSNHQICRAADFVLSSLQKLDWKLQVSAVIIDKITDPQPRQDASAVKSMAAVQGLKLADPHFYRPGRIDVLLGADVLPYIQASEGPKSSIMTMDTVFGHAVMGTYPADRAKPITQAAIQVATETPAPTPDDRLNSTIARFWELEEPPKTKPAFTKEELRVQSEYQLTHTFLPSAGKYQVTLPKKQGQFQLGESRSTALRRFHANEKALIR